LPPHSLKNTEFPIWRRVKSMSGWIRAKRTWQRLCLEQRAEWWGGSCSSPSLVLSLCSVLSGCRLSSPRVRVLFSRPGWRLPFYELTKQNTTLTGRHHNMWNYPDLQLHWTTEYTLKHNVPNRTNERRSEIVCRLYTVETGEQSSLLEWRGSIFYSHGTLLLI